MMNYKKSKGFTLIELLVVIAIISLLSSVVLASLKDARDKARVSAFKQQVDQLILGMELYKSDNKKFMGYVDLAGPEIISYADTQTVTDQETFFDLTFKEYIEKFPIPPSGVVSGVTFYYYTDGEFDGEEISCGTEANIGLIVDMNSQSNKHYDLAFANWEKVGTDFCYPFYGELEEIASPPPGP